MKNWQDRIHFSMQKSLPALNVGTGFFLPFQWTIAVHNCCYGKTSIYKEVVQ